jgi:DNA-binding response OmpR family regulator
LAKIKKPKILIVDDDPFITELYVLKFESAGFKVKSAPDAKSAFKLCTQERPDLILLDIVMPVMNGFEFLEKAKKNKNLKTIPVLAFTNRFSVEYESKARNLGADDYLIKVNFTPSELVTRVKKFLEI